ncbi:MAG: antitoxin VbhA family protein [Reyranella sp.]|nr:antitoxin VbhA family protein [Reyranella sp.]
MPDTVATPQDAAESPDERRAHLDQALASTRLEGHVPTPEYLADCEDFIAGRITRDEVMARSTARALAAERAADAA